MGFMFRMQRRRSMEDLDELLQYKLSIASKLDEETVKSIEADVGLYGDADQFRIFHAVGRFRGLICATLTTGVAMTFLNGGTNGRALIHSKPYLAAAVFGGSFFTYYQFWSRYAGYTDKKFNEFQYARTFKMLRNIQVKQ